MFSSNPDICFLQTKELEMLKLLDSICEKHHLKYYMCGGTLLGAVREKGFIPWDDDVDVMMPRKDYEWLLENRDKIFTDNYYLYDYRVDDYSDNPRRVPALVDRSVKVRMERSNTAREQYLTLDIFVLDGMPHGKIRRCIHYYHFLLIHIFLQLSWYDSQVNQHRMDRALWERAAIWLMNKTSFRPRISSKKMVIKENEILKKYMWDESDYVCSLLGPQKKKEILPKRYFEDIEKLQFESESFNAPTGYHEELEHYYGNYMIPPNRPEEKELHHRITIIQK